MRRRVAALVLLFPLVAAGGALPKGEPSFSRSRWIAERSATAHFDEGLLPATPDVLAAMARARDFAAAPRRKPIPVGSPNLRVSEDILAPDSTSAAQPETEAEPSLAVDPHNERHLVAGYQEDRFADGGARALTYAWTTDGGRRWTEGLLPALSRATGGAFDRASDPWVAFGPEGRVYYAALAFNEDRPDNAITVSTSNDGGLTFAPPAVVHLNLSSDFDDKEAVAVDNAADSPFLGRVYVAWDTVADGGGQPLRIAHSDDDGNSFSAPIEVWNEGDNIGAIPLPGPRGLLYLLWMSFQPDAVAILAARSEDGGETWNHPAVVATARTHGVAELRTGGLVAAAIDPRRGRLYAVWPDDRFTPGADQILLAVSDDGSSWTAPRRVSAGPNNAPCFTPAVAVNGQGRYGVGYATLRNDPARRYLVDQYLTSSDARGRLTVPRRLSTRSFDVRDAAFALGFFLGDYQGLAAGQRNFAPLWVATSEPSRLRAGKQPDAVTLQVR